jgi:lipopolysaccharide transport system permease protein
LIGTLTNLVTLVLAVPILIGAALISGVTLGPSLLMLVYFFFALFLIAYALSLVLGILFVYFRDLRHLMGIFMQLWFYGTPVLYDIKMVPERFRWVLYANPVGSLFGALHTIISQGEWCSFTSVWVTAAWAIGLTMVALWVYSRLANDVAENL